MGVVRGISYNKGNSFKCNSNETGKPDSAGSMSGTAKAYAVGTTLYYYTQSSKAKYPVAICATSGAPWCDGWYKASIFPWATYSVTFNPNNGSASYSKTKTWGTNLTVAGPSKSNTTANGYTVTYNQNGWPNSLGTSVAKDTISYSFNGWVRDDNTSINYGTSIGDKIKAEDTDTTPSTFSVTATYTSSISSRGSVTLKNPTATGYVFKNWQDVNTGTTYSGGQTITPSGNMTLKAVWDYDQATAYVKSSGAWTKGKVYYKENGVWVKAKKIYTKVNGTWVEGKA